MVEIWAYIAEDNPQAANRLLNRFDTMFRNLAGLPTLGTAVVELALHLRLMPIGNYLVFYRPVEDGVEIIRLLHSARDITAEFFRE